MGVDIPGSALCSSYLRVLCPRLCTGIVMSPSVEAEVLFGHCAQPSYTLLVHQSDLCGPGADTLPPARISAPLVHLPKVCVVTPAQQVERGQTDKL